MIDVRDARENVTQTVTLSKFTGTMGGLVMVWTDIPFDGRTDMYVFSRVGVPAEIHRSDVMEPIVRPHAGAIGDAFILMQDNARAHAAQVSMT